MNLQKINWKIYFDPSSKPDPAEFFRVFNSWIPNSPEIFVDVADYRHVHDGPLTLLYGHTTDYALDATDRRLGLLYSRKGEMKGTNGDKLKQTFLELGRACLRLLEDDTLKNTLKFSTSELKFMINDRALAPNTPQTFAALKPALENFFGPLVGKSGFTLDEASQPKQRFSVNVHLKSAPPLEELLKKAG